MARTLYANESHLDLIKSGIVIEIKWDATMQKRREDEMNRITSQQIAKTGRQIK